MISEVKRVEIRDNMTCIPALAFQVTGGEADPLLWRAGFGAERPLVILVHLGTPSCEWDPYAWGNRTMQTVHRWLEEHFTEHLDGAVVDVEFILGERSVPKESDIVPIEWDGDPNPRRA